ncbi:hypothetical protein V6N13_049257 [Hibiscus sabdariffa]|uniref:AAA+ ATPase domain-containing protein n=1 Tax=Hibiscus sabdariffa TaxID=183260 RepID=A0ABR2QXU6_9ROSI
MSSEEEEEDMFRIRVRSAMRIRDKMVKHETESRLEQAMEDLTAVKKEFEKTEQDLKYLRTAGEFVGRVGGHLDKERFIVGVDDGESYLGGCGSELLNKERLSKGTRRVVVGCISKVDKEILTSGTRVSLDRATLQISWILPPQVAAAVYYMAHQDPGNISYSALGGLSEQLQELRECVELPLLNPELFLKVGVKPPKGVLLYGPPGTGKTLLARAIASNVDATFLAVRLLFRIRFSSYLRVHLAIHVVSSSILGKYIGDGARLIRQMFSYARYHQPCIIFMDEIDAIGGRRSSRGKDCDSEVVKTMMELLNQLDGFNQLDNVKVIMATNQLDALDPALVRPGRLDRKIEIRLPNERSRMEILKIHVAPMAKQGEIDYEAVVRLAEGFNGADLQNVCMEAGMFAMRADRDHVIQGDFMKAVRKVNEAKKLEPSADWGRY